MNTNSTNKVSQNIQILQQYNIPFIWKNQSNGHIEIQYEGAIVHCWLSTASFRNVNTGKSGKGIYNLISYLDWIKNNKGKSKSEASKTEPDNDFNLALIDRVALLEQRLESYLERIAELENMVFKK